MKNSFNSLFALSLLIPALAHGLPTKDSIIYHGSQFAAGAAIKFIADKVSEDCSHSTRVCIHTAALLTALNVPDYLNQASVVKPYADKQTKDTGRFAYYFGLCMGPQLITALFAAKAKPTMQARK